MTEGRACQNCGSISHDAEWCDVCGADLSEHAADDAWLELGDAITFIVEDASPPPVAGYISEDTLPPELPRGAVRDTLDADVDEDAMTGSGPTEPTIARGTVRDAIDAGVDEDAMTGSGPTEPTIARPAPTRPPVLPNTSLDIAVGDTAAHPVPGGDMPSLTVTVEERVADLGYKRVFSAVDAAGRRYRLEERAGGAAEAVPPAARALGWLLDLPLGAAPNGSHEVRVYRHVPGPTMQERLDAREEPMTPSEIVEWMRPVTRAIKAIHDAGFLCLRLCPYTVKYTEGGGVFLHGVEVLYPQDTELEKLPAIAGYTAPEVYAASVGAPPSVAADLYMAGMMVYFLIARADPPSSVYSGHIPVLLARDHAPWFPLGFAPALTSLGAAHPADRPRSAEEFLDVVVHARDRSVRQVSGFEDVRVGVAADTHVGIVKRLHTAVNQDTVFAATDPDGTTALMLVADGVSTATYGSGDRASRVAGTIATAAWHTWLQSPTAVRERGIARWLDDIVQEMNRGVVAEVDQDYAPFPTEPSEVMGSTCVVAFVRNGICHVASLGDSRAYLVRDGFLEQITRDHNLMTLGIVQGLDPDTAVTFPQGDALARCLGTFEWADEHIVPSAVEPDHYVFPLLPGDRLLLCSDGLTDYAGRTPEEVEQYVYETVMSGDLPELICLDLIRLANEGGGGDNIGCALAIAAPEYTDAMEWFAELQELAEDHEY